MVWFSGRTIILFISLSRLNGALCGWIDEDTPKEKRTTTSLIDGSEYQLVMSDEFSEKGRTFKDGDDPTWTALDKSDDDSSAAGGGSLHFYNSSNIKITDDGQLEILTELDKTEWRHYDIVKKKYKHVTKYFKSGMLQSWDKFCFTGGIVEVDVIFPGDPYIGGVWPAIWLLGNLGRATYEASTNNIWPWSYDTCDRDQQEAQTVSACNVQNHFGLNAFQGRGATEIDLVEVMTGYSEEPLPATEPPVRMPYADLTLQVAPGITDNRPQSGQQPRRDTALTNNGHTEWLAQTWYEGLEVSGNTTLNPFFYGTYLGETKPEEPVSRNKNQVFQADAVGAMHQLTPAHFNRKHTFRLEWQPGEGGRLDWFVKDHKLNATASMEGDGKGQDWLKAFSIKDESLKNVTGAQIPIEPSYLIFNTGVSSTWGFPYDVPDDCEKCYDCSNATCACAFYPGFCSMMKKSKVAMYIDHVRVYQSNDDSAHVGKPHTVGCDPVEYPTKEFIEGHQYRYMRSPPFSIDDKLPLKKHIKKGGGKCLTNSDCGGVDGDDHSKGKGFCKKGQFSQGLFASAVSESRCECNDGYLGPQCLVGDHHDDQPGAKEINSGLGVFKDLPTPALPLTLSGVLFCLVILILSVTMRQTVKNQKEIENLRLLKQHEKNAVELSGAILS
jgi:hypothetical protein